MAFFPMARPLRIEFLGAVYHVTSRGKDVLGDKNSRDERIFEAVQKHEYAQKKVADHLKLHFISVSRIMRANGTKQKYRVDSHADKND